MEAIYSSSALRTNQREVKEAARKDVVHITENGNGAFIMCSEDVFEKKLREAADEALYERDFADAVREGREDFETGRYSDDVDGLFARLERKLAG